MHTKGHWKVEHLGEYQIYDQGDMLIASIAEEKYSDPEANARLISAAPDLLEACKFAWTLLTSQAAKNIGMNDSWWRDASKLRINSLEQAISKAEKGE